ncbi:MAG: MotA/TolQ/ExbB proton channel family protein [Nitrospirales bacterium]
MFQSSPLGLVGSLGAVSTAVLLVLFIFSVMSWVIILSKWLIFRSSDREDTHFLTTYAQTPDNSEIRRQARGLADSPSAAVFLGVLDRLGADEASLTRSPSPTRANPEPTPNPLAVDRQYLERTVTYIVQGQISKLESYLPFLATTGNITPFIGLLGTVIGIIDAFHAIGLEGSASLAAVAPGVAEALVATAAGLFTAIPAVIAYNYYLTRIRRAAFRAETFSVDFLNYVQARARQAQG